MRTYKRDSACMYASNNNNNILRLIEKKLKLKLHFRLTC